MWVVLVVLIALAAGGLPSVIPGRACPLPTRNQLLPCVESMDANLDDTITAAEIDAFMLQHASCIPNAVRTALTGAHIVALCDTDSSGNLTDVDWNAANGCFHLRERQMTLCRACDRCGLLGGLLKKTVQK